MDQATVVFMPVREREVVLTGAAAPAGCKLFNFVEKAAGADADAFLSAWAAAAATLHAGPLAASITRHVQNDVLPKPGPPATVDGIDEFWLVDEAAARALLMHWQAALQQALVATGLAVDAGSFALLAHEAVLHAGPR